MAAEETLRNKIQRDLGIENISISWAPEIIDITVEANSEKEEGIVDSIYQFGLETLRERIINNNENLLNELLDTEIWGIDDCGADKVYNILFNFENNFRGIQFQVHGLEDNNEISLSIYSDKWKDIKKFIEEYANPDVFEQKTFMTYDEITFKKIEIKLDYSNIYKVHVDGKFYTTIEIWDGFDEENWDETKTNWSKKDWNIVNYWKSCDDFPCTEGLSFNSINDFLVKKYLWSKNKMNINEVTKDVKNQFELSCDIVIKSYINYIQRLMNN